MPSLRIQRVRSLLKRELGEIVRRDFPVDEVGVITVNEVELTTDLQMATVYVGVVGTDEQRRRAAGLLNGARKRIQGQLGRAVVLKYMPQLRFVLDEAIQRGNRVLEIIEELERSPSPNEGTSEDH